MRATQLALVAAAHSVTVLQASLVVSPKYACSYDEPKTWVGAAAQCQAFGGALATVRSAEENAAIAALNPNMYDARLWTWIGLHDVYSATEGVWQSGQNFDEYEYSNWAAPNEPSGDNGYGAVERCTLMFAYGDAYALWLDSQCDNAETLHSWCCECPAGEEPASNGACATPATTTTQTETTTFHTTTTTTFPEASLVISPKYACSYDERKTWVGAAAQCEAFGGALATVRSAEENAAIAALNPNMYDARHWTWIGLHDVYSATEGVWQSGRHFDEHEYSNWWGSEPSGWNGYAVERCTQMVAYGDAYALWNDAQCDNAETLHSWCCECPAGEEPASTGACVPSTTTATQTATATSTTTTTEPPMPEPVSPGDAVEVRCAMSGNAGYHPARVHNVSSSSIVVAYEHLGHLYYCAPKQWRKASGLQGQPCAEHGGILPAEHGSHKCCPASCGVCGAPDCHLMPGGRGDCCTGRIPNNKFCGVNGNRAPCSLMPRLPTDPMLSQRRLRGTGVAEENLAAAPFWVKDAADVQIVA